MKPVLSEWFDNMSYTTYNIKGDINQYMQIEVVFYETEDGKKPAKLFLTSLQDRKLKAKIYKTIELLEWQGIELREPYSKYLGDGIFELRTKQGSNMSRVLYFFFVDNRAILTNGLIKKSQKTPRQAIETAKRYKADYERRSRNGKIS